MTGNLTLHDVSRDGRALMAHDALRSGILAFVPGDARERDLSWLDWSSVRDIARDGSVFVFSETGKEGDRGYSSYSRRMDGSPPVRLGDGNPMSISPDGRWALAIASVSAATPRLQTPSHGSGRSPGRSPPQG